MVRKAGMPKNNFSRTVLFAGDFVDERKAARPSRPIAGLRTTGIGATRRSAYCGTTHWSAMGYNGSARISR
jgi:hypothetical protein